MLATVIIITEKLKWRKTFGQGRKRLAVSPHPSSFSLSLLFDKESWKSLLSRGSHRLIHVLSHFDGSPLSLCTGQQTINVNDTVEVYLKEGGKEKRAKTALRNLKKRRKK